MYSIIHVCDVLVEEVGEGRRVITQNRLCNHRETKDTLVR